MLDTATIQLTVPHTDAENLRILVPMTVLDAVEGAADEIVVSVRKGTARWEGRDGPQSHTFKLEEPSPTTREEVPEDALRPVAATFLTALYECGRTAARESDRYAIHRVQVDGKAGTVTATDGKVALIHRGFTLPFRETMLTPALPVFGVKELMDEADVRVGRVAERPFVRAGPWTVTLAIAADGRLPDVSSVIPKSSKSTVLEVDDRDANELLSQLPEWPDASDGTAAVTIDVNESITTRARNNDTGEEREFRLSRSTSTGPAVRLAVDRRHFIRALTIGFRSFRLAAGQPLVAEGPERTFIAVTLDAGQIVEPRVSDSTPQPS